MATNDSINRPRWKNWAGNQECMPEQIATPTDIDELASLVTHAAETGRRVKFWGAGHSFTDIALTDGLMLSLDGLSGLSKVDRANHRARMKAGTRLWQAAELLAGVGMGFSSLGDINKQSLAGAASTATHGTGRDHGNISSQLCGIDLMTASGEVLETSPEKNPEIFAAAQVSLGALGVITAVTIQAEPAFNLETREEPVPWEETLENAHDTVAANEHFEFFWFPHTDLTLTLTHNRTDKPARDPKPLKDWWYTVVRGNYVWDLACRLGRTFPSLIPAINQKVSSQASGAKRVQRGDRAFCNERRVKFVEMEYAIPREETVPVLREVRRAIESSGLHILFPIEVRFVPGDDIWMSPSYGRDTTYIAVHVYKGMEYVRYFQMIEAIMDRVDGRPHWGKMHFQRRETLRARFDRFDDFVAVRNELDPEGVFSNDYTDRVLGTRVTRRSRS